MKMSELASQDAAEYVLQVTFLMSGILVTVNAAAIMHKLIVRLCTTHQEQLKEYSTLMPVQSQMGYNSDPNYYERTDATNSRLSSSELQNRKNSSTVLANNSESKHIDKIKLSSKAHVSYENHHEINNLMLLKLLFVCYLFESICIIVNAIFTDDTVYQESAKQCNFSISQKDCMVLNTVVLLKRNTLSAFVSTLGNTVLLLLPFISVLVNLCLQNFLKSFLCSFIILFFFLVSRCFGFLFFPHFILQASNYSYTIERLISLWMAFLLMGLGMKLTSASTTNINKESKPDLMFPDGSVEDHNHLTEARKTEAKSIKSLDQGNGSLHNPKRYIRRSNSEMTFGSDSFVPCVVLISNQNVNCHKPITNIGTSFRGSRTRRRASLDVINENNNINKATKWSEVVHRRRTSLPAVLASCKKKTVMSSVLVDTSTLAEVHAAVEELSKQPSNLVDFVNKLQDLLSPYKLDQVKPRQVVWLQKHNDGSDDETICLSPTRISSKRLQRRQEWQNGHRDLFSTTTTATGLPKEEPILPKPRRLPKIWKDKTPVGTPLDSRCGSPGSEGVIPYNIGRRRTYPNIPVSHAHNIFSTSPNTAITNAVSAISSDYESDDPIAPTTVRSKSVAEDEERRSHPHHHFVLDGRLTPPILPSEEVYHRSGAVTPPLEKHKILEEDIVADGRHNNQFSCDQIDEGHSLFQSYQEQLLDSVYNWNFQIFQLAEDTNCVLSQMAFKLFQDTGLFDTFNIPKREFVCYMKALESGYRRIPYHNRIHAADVLHGCWFLSTQEIPGFHDHSPLFSSDSSDSDSGTSTTNARQVNNIGNGSLAQAIPALELMSLYLAAAMHDYDHPGRTNAFLVETRHPLAILYNDRSVLENHHASASWDLLYSDENFDFLKNLDTAEWKRLRFLIVEAILATDLKKHRDILAQFQAKSQQPLSRCTSTDETGVDTPARTGFNWSADEDRLLVCKMVIKLADIGGPAKSKRLHITWTKAICEEFFIQGDEERRLGVPVSPFMDRERPQVAELQRTFITNLIKPIVTSMHKTGILAGVIPGDNDTDVDEGPTSENNLLLEQLKSNLSYWMISTSLSGHEEMAEAFKFALTYRLSSSSGTDAVATPAKSKEIDSTSHRTPTSNPTDDGAQARPDDDEVFDEDIDSCGEKRDLKFNNTLPSVQTTRNSSNSKFFQTNESGNINVSRRHSSAALPSRTSHAGSD